MDPSDLSAGKSPKRELQGPRPAPLKLRKDSHKIRKPPVAPPQQIPSQPPQQHRPPVIIYTVSPKVIHANPSEFMTLVQRLTGSINTSSTTTTTFSSSSRGSGGATVSPAARFAVTERARAATEAKKNRPKSEMEGVEGVERTGNLFPGILSPGPGSLQPIPPSFFSSSSSSSSSVMVDPSSFGFFPDMSPLGNIREGGSSSSFMVSMMMMQGSPSSTSIFSPQINYSPTPSLDLFNNFSDS